MEEKFNIKSESLYTFYSAKKIYLAQTPSKYLLIEKKNDNNSNSRVLSLVSRKTVVISKVNGMLLFPKNK